MSVITREAYPRSNQSWSFRSKSTRSTRGVDEIDTSLERRERWHRILYKKVISGKENLRVRTKEPPTQIPNKPSKRKRPCRGAKDEKHSDKDKKPHCGGRKRRGKESQKATLGLNIAQDADQSWRRDLRPSDLQAWEEHERLAKVVRETRWRREQDQLIENQAHDKEEIVARYKECKSPEFREKKYRKIAKMDLDETNYFDRKRDHYDTMLCERRKDAFLKDRTIQREERRMWHRDARAWEEQESRKAIERKAYKNDFVQIRTSKLERHDELEALLAESSQTVPARPEMEDELNELEEWIKASAREEEMFRDMDYYSSNVKSRKNQYLDAKAMERDLNRLTVGRMM